MKRTLLLSISGAIMMSLLALAGWPPGPARAFNPQPEPPRFGMVGMTATQTMRLNVVSMGEVSGIDPTPFMLQFRDSRGDVVAELPEVLLLPGQAAYLDVEGREMVSGRRARVELQAVVIQDPRGTRPRDAFLGLVTVEVFNTLTGRTTLLYGGYP